jgi:hypothetical protein
MTKEIFTEQETERLNRLIINRTEEFNGNIETFSWFIDNAIKRELHALTTNEYIGNKPNLTDFENIIQNTRLLEDIFEFMMQKQMIENN